MARPNDELNQEFLDDLINNYFPYLKSIGYTDLELQQMWENILHSLDPMPYTDEEIEAYYREKGEAVPLDSDGLPDIDYIERKLKSDPSLRPKQIFQLDIYDKYTTWRKGVKTAKEQESYNQREFEAVRISGGETLRDYLSRKVLTGDYTPQQATEKLMRTGMYTSIGEGMQLNEAFDKARKQEQEQWDIYRAGLRQNEVNRIVQGEIARVDAELEQKLLPMPTSTELTYQGKKSVSGMESAAMGEFAESRLGGLWQEFMGTGGEKALQEWWKELNMPLIIEAEEKKREIYNRVPTQAGQAALDYMTINPNLPPEQRQMKTGQENIAAWGAMLPYQQKIYQDTMGYDYAGYAGMPGFDAGVLAEGLQRQAATQKAEQEKRTAGLLAENPWQKKLKEQEWYKEFWSTPRAYRPGGYAERSLRPSIKQRYA
jgi:hypothetical protein